MTIRSSFAALAGLILVAVLLFVVRNDRGVIHDPVSPRLARPTPDSRHATLDADGEPVLVDPPRARRSESASLEPALDLHTAPGESPRESEGVDPRPDSTFEAARSTLTRAIDAHLPELRLSRSELDALTDATLRLRRAQTELRNLPETREDASRRERVRRKLEAAIVDFTRLVEMTPAEFTKRVQPEVGIDELSPDGNPGDVSIRALRAREEPE